MAQKIAIPDHKFEEALVKIGIDSEIDGFLNIDKAKAVDTLVLGTGMISDLTGIEAFTELKYLSCGQNLIKKIDLSKNTKLRHLYCGNSIDFMYEFGDDFDDYRFNEDLGNQLTELDLSNNVELEYIEVDFNKLRSLDLQNNKKLIYLSVSSNKLSKLNIDGNKKLEILHAEYNELKKLNLQNNLNIEIIGLMNNQLSAIDIKKNKQLKELDLSHNKLKEIDVTNNALLEYLDC